mmetsp:Transcript_10136/g.17183  ORF Transcript_10136/g.17183 Transcript_10136/m.17183 type:complete len:227 (+) Transcript_10136:277-957(+)
MGRGRQPRGEAAQVAPSGPLRATCPPTCRAPGDHAGRKVEGGDRSAGRAASGCQCVPEDSRSVGGQHRRECGRREGRPQSHQSGCSHREHRDLGSHREHCDPRIPQWVFPTSRVRPHIQTYVPGLHARHNPQVRLQSHLWLQRTCGIRLLLIRWGTCSAGLYLCQAGCCQNQPLHCRTRPWHGGFQSGSHTETEGRRKAGTRNRRDRLAQGARGTHKDPGQARSRR